MDGLGAVPLPAEVQLRGLRSKLNPVLHLPHRPAEFQPVDLVRRRPVCRPGVALQNAGPVLPVASEESAPVIVHTVCLAALSKLLKNLIFENTCCFSEGLSHKTDRTLPVCKFNIPFEFQPPYQVYILRSLLYLN